MGRSEANKISKLVPQALPHLHVNRAKRHLRKAPRRVVDPPEKSLAYPSDKGFDSWVGMRPSRDLIRERSFQEVPCQQETEKEHPLATQPTGPFHYPPPVHILVCANQLGNVADVFQPVPSVFGGLYAEDQQRIFRRESRNVAPPEGYPVEPLPQALWIQGKREGLLHDRPMQINHTPVVLVHELMLAVVPEKGRFLGKGQPVPRVIPRSRQ